MYVQISSKNKIKNLEGKKTTHNSGLSQFQKITLEDDHIHINIHKALCVHICVFL